jgi:hypothetical protein
MNPRKITILISTKTISVHTEVISRSPSLCSGGSLEETAGLLIDLLLEILQEKDILLTVVVDGRLVSFGLLVEHGCTQVRNILLLACSLLLADEILFGKERCLGLRTDAWSE